MRSNVFMATIALVLVAVQAAPLVNGINNGIVGRDLESTGHVNDNAKVNVEKRARANYNFQDLETPEVEKRVKFGYYKFQDLETPEVNVEKRSRNLYFKETPEVDVEKRSSFRYKFIKEEEDNLSDTLEVDIEKRGGTRYYIGTKDSDSPSETPEVDVDERSLGI